MNLNRGEFNRNPGNLAYIADPAHAFRGQIGIEIVRPGHDYTPRFGRYDTAEHGIRAASYQLILYKREYGANTIRKIVGHWAPNSDGNNDNAYIDAMEKFSGFAADDIVDLMDTHTNFAIVKGVIQVEEGRCIYTDDMIMMSCKDAIASQPKGV